MSSPPLSVKIGLFGIGLDAYWPPFKGLKDKLTGYQQQTKVPVVVLNLQPVSRIDYEAFNKLPSREEKTGEWLAHCQACSVPEIASVFNRAGIDYHLITGTLSDPAAWQEIHHWVEAARAARLLRQSRIGLLGHYYGGMLDVYSDYTQLAGVFGNHFSLVEMDELKALRDAVTDQEVAQMRAEFGRTFAVSPECSPAELDRAARTSVALHKLVERHRGIQFQQVC